MSDGGWGHVRGGQHADFHSGLDSSLRRWMLLALLA